MDGTDFTLRNENKLPIIVLDLNEPGNLRRVVTGERVGTLVEFQGRYAFVAMTRYSCTS